MKVEEGLVGKKIFIRDKRVMEEYCGGENNNNKNNYINI